MAAAPKKAKAAAGPVETAIVTILSPVKHDGDVYALGDQLELPATAAARLVKLQAAVIVPPVAAVMVEPPKA